MEEINLVFEFTNIHFVEEKKFQLSKSKKRTPYKKLENFINVSNFYLFLFFRIR